MSEQQSPEAVDNQLRSPAGILIFDKFLFEPRDVEWTRDGKTEQGHLWSAQLAFSPDDDLSEMKEAAKALFNKKWPKDRFNSVASPFKQYTGNHESIGDDWIQVNFSTYQKPQVVDRRGQPIDPSAGEIYSGCRVIAVGFPKTSGGTGDQAKKVSFVLTGIQLIEKLDPFFKGSDKPKQVTDPSKHFVNMDEAGEDAIAESMF